MRGLKENVIMGRLIPAGIGLEYYRRSKIAGKDVGQSVEQQPENILDSLSAYDDDPIGMDDVE